jgi:hypothetical protein
MVSVGLIPGTEGKVAPLITWRSGAWCVIRSASTMPQRRYP